MVGPKGGPSHRAPSKYATASVTLWHCIKTATPKITKSSLLAASRSLVFRDKISCPWVKGFPSNEGVKEGYPLKMLFCRYWLV